MTTGDRPAPWGYAITADPAGVLAYQQGVVALVDGHLDTAQDLLCQALVIDDDFALAWAALAVLLDRAGQPCAADALGRALDAGRRASRSERHHVTIISLALGPHHDRATGLALDHLTDYPADVLVQALTARRAVTPAPPTCSHQATATASPSGNIAAMESCDVCGFEWASVPREDIARRVHAGAEHIAVSLRTHRDIAARRPEPHRWSMLEYAGHVRDVLLHLRDRLIIGLVEDNPEFKPLYRDRLERRRTPWGGARRRVVCQLTDGVTQGLVSRRSANRQRAERTSSTHPATTRCGGHSARSLTC